MTLQLKITDNGYDASEPNSCSVIGCKEEMNGLWYMTVGMGELETVLSFCEEHHNMITAMLSEQSKNKKTKWLLEWTDSIVLRKEVFDTELELQDRIKELNDEFWSVGGVTARFGVATQVSELVWRFTKENEVKQQ